MAETMQPDQIDALARRTNPGFDSCSAARREEIREEVRALLGAMDAEGWEVGRRVDRTSFEMAQWIFLRVDANITASTPKAVIILSLHGVLLSATILQGERIVHEASNGLRTAVGGLLVVLFLSAAAALWLAFSSVAPRIAKSTGKRSLLFFGSIAAMPKTEFVQEFEHSDRAAFTRDLVEEVHALSGLADWKHRMFVRAFRIILFVEIPLMALIAILVSF